jgi:hypothetical protein
MSMTREVEVRRYARLLEQDLDVSRPDPGFQRLDLGVVLVRIPYPPRALVVETS